MLHYGPPPSFVEEHIGTYTVNARYNAAGRYTDQSHPDMTKANPYFGNSIPPGPIFIDAAPGRYRIITESAAGCSIWSGNSSTGAWFASYPSVEFEHQFGEIALYFWDWYAYDNDPSVEVIISVYQLKTDWLTNVAVNPANPVISTRQAVQFTATGVFAIHGARPLTPADGVVWNSSDPSVATIDAAGLATPHSQGYTAVTACNDGVCGSAWLFVTNHPPTVVKPPLNQSVRPGVDVTWRVAANGSQPMSHQWQFNGINIDGANGECLTIANASPENAGLYSLVIANPFGTNTVQAALSLVDLKMFAGLIIAGPPGQYRIEAMESMGGANTWTILGTNTVTQQQMPFYNFDTNSPSNSQRFYRSIWMP
jgi:hypothetical protein